MDVNLITLKAGGVIEVWIELYKSLFACCKKTHAFNSEYVHNYNSRRIFAMQILLIS